MNPAEEKTSPSDPKLHNRQQHQAEVREFLQAQFSHRDWQFSQPHGYGNESYFAHGGGVSYFIKLAVPLVNYQAMASLGFTPPLLATGILEDGTSLLVQPFIDGRKPSRQDFYTYLERIAGMIGKMHHSIDVSRVLPQPCSSQYNLLALDALARLQRRWQRYRSQVAAIAGWIDEKLALLAEQVQSMSGAGPVASHNDICNANWLITPDERIYLIDLDAMSLDDPAADLGAILWWYYPPGLRKRFIECAGYPYDECLRYRMHLRMAIHCLHIILPRESSFDSFDPHSFTDALVDFKAIIEGGENPQGYAKVIYSS